MQGSSNCRPSPTAQSDSSPSSSSGTSLLSLTSSSSPSSGPFVFSCHSSSSLYSFSSASSIFSTSFASSSSSSPFLLILYVFILLVHTLSYSSSCTSSLTFLSPLLHHLHPSPPLLPFPP